MKYKANMMVNGGTYLMHDLTGNNKRTLAAEIRERANGEVFAGRHGIWWVVDENDQTVFHGQVRG